MHDDSAELCSLPHTRINLSQGNDIDIERTKSNSKQYDIAGRDGIATTTHVDITFETRG